MFLEYILQGIAIDERVLMMWRKHSDGVPNVLIDITNILSKGAGNATLTQDVDANGNPMGFFGPLDL